MTRTPDNLPWYKRAALPAFFGAVVTLIVHLVPANVTLIGWDEWILASIMGRIATWWLPAGEWYDVLVPTTYAYPPSFFWTGGFLAYLFDPAPFIYRLPTTLSATACTTVTALIAHRAAGLWGAWTAALLSATAMYLTFQNTISMDYFMAVWILLSLYAFIRGLDKNSEFLIVLAVFLGGMAAFAKYHGVVYHAFICIAVLITPTSRRLMARSYFALYVTAALAIPALLILLEALPWHYYGFQHTHIAEAMRMTDWQPLAPDPLTGAIIQPPWHYYLEIIFLRLGIIPCALTAAGVVLANRRRNTSALIILAAAVLWFLWAAAMPMKHARYIVPAVYLMFVLTGIGIAGLAQYRAGKHYAIVLLAIIAVGAGWRLRERIEDYLAQAQRHETIYAAALKHAADGVPIFADALPFRPPAGHGLDEPAYPAQSTAAPQWLQDARFVISEERAYRMMASGMIQSSETYLQWRPIIWREWDVIVDLGLGRDRIKLLGRPPGWTWDSQQFGLDDEGP